MTHEKRGLKHYTREKDMSLMQVHQTKHQVLQLQTRGLI